MDTETLLKNFNELNARIAAARKEMGSKSKVLIEAVAKQFLDKCPEVTGVHWTQYTPYFNDGDTCEFGVNEYCFHILDEDNDEVESFYESTELYTQVDLDKALEKLEEAKVYVANPEAWRNNYLKEYQAKWGRAYAGGTGWLRPYPNTIEDAQERIDRITKNLETYGPEVAARITEEFSVFRKAMQRIDDSIMESIFGNHVCVVINREGTTVEEFDHD